MSGVSGVSALRVQPFGGRRGYRYMGGSMDFWITDRIPIDSIAGKGVGQYWPMWLWDRMPISVYVGP